MPEERRLKKGRRTKLTAVKTLPDRRLYIIFNKSMVFSPITNIPLGVERPPAQLLCYLFKASSPHTQPILRLLSNLYVMVYPPNSNPDTKTALIVCHYPRHPTLCTRLQCSRGCQGNLRTPPLNLRQPIRGILMHLMIPQRFLLLRNMPLMLHRKPQRFLLFPKSAKILPQYFPKATHWFIHSFSNVPASAA